MSGTASPGMAEEAFAAPLRCLVVVGSLARGGAERQAMLTAVALRSAGVEARLFVAGAPVDQADEAAALGIPLELGPRPESGFSQVARLRRVIAEFHPHAAITFLTGASKRFLLARMSFPEAHDVGWIVAERGNIRGRDLIRHPISHWLRLRCLQAADRVTVNSATLAANLFAFGGDLGTKVEVVPNVLLPVDGDPGRATELVRALLPADAQGPIVGTLGSFQDERNPGLLAEAFRVLLGTQPGAHLLVIGRTTGPECAPAAGQFIRRMLELGIRDRVTLAGEIGAARTLLGGLDLFVLASKLEGSSNAVSEALVAGAVIAATPVADTEGLLAGAGAVSSGWTPTSLAAAMQAALETPLAMREAARARGEQLLRERAPEQVGRVWERLVRAVGRDVAAH